MKITINITLPPNADEGGVEVIKKRLPEELRALLMKVANATIPDSDSRRDGAEVEVSLS